MLAAQLDLANHAWRWIEDDIAVPESQIFDAAEMEVAHHFQQAGETRRQRFFRR